MGRLFILGTIHLHTDFLAVLSPSVVDSNRGRGASSGQFGRGMLGIQVLQLSFKILTLIPIVTRPSSLLTVFAVFEVHCGQVSIVSFLSNFG